MHGSTGRDWRRASATASGPARRWETAGKSATAYRAPRQSLTLLTHICGKNRKGSFWLRRSTTARRLRAKLKQVKDQLRRRRQRPIPEQGRWLASVVRGHLAYYAVPGNSRAIGAFHRQVGRLWLDALRRRSQRHRLPWPRMKRLIAHWLPPARILHPYPEVRFDVRTRGRSPVW
jgi:RNA-directed DNA polymerase